MKARFSPVDKKAIIVFIFGLTIRLCAIPFSMTDEADAVTRIFIALEWMQNPHLITFGVWGPFHTYMIAGILTLWNDPVYAPILLNSIISAAIAIPLYLFVKQEWNEKAALFVTCIYIVYPVAIRYGLVALSEIPFIFFLILTLWLLSCARDETGNWKHALLAGLAITLAGSLRYEAWGLTPILGLSLIKKPKNLVVFLSSAIIFPVFWMIGNFVQFGDALYSFHWSTDWNLNISALNEGLSTIDILNRATYFPRVLFFGLTPLIFLVCMVGIIQVVWNRSKQWLWLIPLFMLFITFTINAVNGNLTTQVRYSLGLAIFIIPFAAEWYENLKKFRTRIFLIILVVGSMLPFSFLRNAIPWPFTIPNPIPRKISPIPRVDKQVEYISDYLNNQPELENGGLLLDFVDWGDTYYLALNSRKSPENIFIMPGEVNEYPDLKLLQDFIYRNPKGLALLASDPRFIQIEHSNEGDWLSFTDLEFSFKIDVVKKVGPLTLYKYSLLP